MGKDLNAIKLKPAKRVLTLYLIAFLILITLIGLILFSLAQRTEINESVLIYLWMASVVFGGVLLCYAALWRLTCSYILSSECVTASTGILSRQDHRIALSQIVDYRVMRPLIERVVGLGDLYIDTAGRDSDELIMHQISIKELEKVILRLNKLLNQDQNKLEKIEKLVMSS